MPRRTTTGEGVADEEDEEAVGAVGAVAVGAMGVRRGRPPVTTRPTPRRPRPISGSCGLVELLVGPGLVGPDTQQTV